MRENVPNRMLIIETLPRSASTDFGKSLFVRRPTLIRETKSQRFRNLLKLSLPQPLPTQTIIDPLSTKQRRKDESRTDRRPIKVTPLERSNSNGIGSHSNVRHLKLKQDVLPNLSLRSFRF
jgi:hypothetical protein